MGKRINIFLCFVLGILGINEATRAEPLFPFNQGTQWTYVTTDGAKKTVLVEGHLTLTTSEGKIRAALLRRDDGTDRLVFRTTHQWFECPDASAVRQSIHCGEPLLFFQWPLLPQQSWVSGDLRFQVLGQEAVQVPFQPISSAWKISYAPPGHVQPWGEMWIAPEIGRVQIREREITYRLSEYMAGKGEPLASSAEEAVAALLQPRLPETPSSTAKGAKQFLRRHRTWTIWGGLVVALAFPFYFLGLGLVSSLRRREKDEELPNSADPKEEAKLLAAIARGGDVTQARQRLEEMVAEHPKFADLHQQLALLLRIEGNLEGAKEHFEEAIGLNAHYTEAHLGLAHLVLGMGEASQAAEAFEKVTKLQPTYVDAYVGLARAHLAMKRWDAGAESLAKALELNPNLQEAKELLTQCRNSAQPPPETSKA